jgi:carboxylesterase type B
MFWIFGRGFLEGSGSDPGTDGTSLASRGDVVVVNVNHRLGNLGWLALDDGVTYGNYELQDIITALQWVSTNIEAFGDDPSRVTIFGKSSGAAAVRSLLALPKTKGLFSGAIMESTPVGFSVNALYSNYSTAQYEVEAVAAPMLNLTGCLNSAD